MCRVRPRSRRRAVRRARLLTKADGIVILALLLGAGLGFLLAPKPSRPTRCEIRTAQGTSWLELPAATVLRLRGPVGVTKVVVSGMTVRIADSDCPARICVRTGIISRAGQMVVCVPNRVAVRLDGGGLDAIAR